MSATKLPGLLAPRSTAAEYDKLLGVAKSVAAHFARRLPGRVDEQDLVSAGYLGLVDAIDKHAHLLGTSTEDFEMLARCRIRGAIRDELRKNDPVPRRTRKRARKLSKVEADLSRALGRAPQEDELAASAGITPSDCRQLRAQAATRVVSMEPLLEEGRLTLPTRDSLAPDVQVQRREAHTRIEECQAKLTDRERLVLRGLYCEGRTLREIGEELGVTEARVSQIHTRALERLREMVGES